jgi:hypothetical protein
MKLKTEAEIKAILKSIREVFEYRNIEYLTKSAYGYLYLCSGFIAHYNLNGFRDAYRNIETLREALFSNEPMNQWRNFLPEDHDYEYMMQKRNIYNRIVAIAEENT